MAFTVRQMRLAREISQETMAEKLGVHVNTYASMEKNPENISVKNANLIAEILHCEIDDLIFLPSTLQNVD